MFSWHKSAILRLSKYQDLDRKMYKEIEMNSMQNQEPRLAFCIQWARTCGSWLVGPAPLAVTCDEFLGSIEKEIEKEGIHGHSEKFALPEVGPDEFERVFQWFQS
jgi:hypothetical protein